MPPTACETTDGSTIAVLRCGFCSSFLLKFEVFRHGIFPQSGAKVGITRRIIIFADAFFINIAMFENLTDKLERSFKILKGEGKITEINVAETLKEIRRALIDADVNYKVAKTFTDTVKAKALGENVLTAVKPGQMMTKIVRDELALLMGGTATDINLTGQPAVILIAGLQGSGKTTFSGKLAAFIKSKKGRQVLLVAGDVYRPAAIEQLKILGQGIGVEVYTEEGSTNPVQIAENAIKYAKSHSINTVIVDTAGRLAVDEGMMQEIAAIKAAVKPSETLFVVDAMTGQDAVNTAREFNNRLDFDGVVLTKLDGDTRGGTAISIRSVVAKPLKFISSGEKMDALQVFHPERMADRILGMGDVVSLVERAQEQYDEEEARRTRKKLYKDQFDFNDFLDQINQVKKMGNMKELMSMIPGVGKALRDVEISDDVFKQTEAIIGSMTPAERSNPALINASRRERIARGSGTSLPDVNRLMKQFEQSRKMMRSAVGMGGMKGMAQAAMRARRG
jgi:signal recognition particle subunit SRP54